MTDKPTIFVVDDDTAVRDSLRWVIESNGWNVETYASAEAFLDAFTPPRLGCLILDVRMPGLSGPELQKLLNERRCLLPIIFITAHGTVPTAVRAMQSGAVDFIMKPFNNIDLLERIDQCVDRAKQDVANRTQDDVLHTRLAALTPREREVMEHVVAGKPNKRIAADLGLSIKTVEAHRAKIMQKMQAHSLAELVRLVLAHPARQGKP
jgi:two-component system response regulator FixJ